ncbi:NYN domain-containing protein [Tropicibacter naphthalenivorans]|uniref:6-hydroxy-3-succinoylpyridine 3-monooxygenase HspA n=1 Tax=Tropicibacter naphthalenivorans TaxID=441103 RepID=A0A0P1GWL9_9RHOB|nr:NYN domain-containing protein [Tropicibacter naphthalenivorans]CUH79549.1 6-hydroxy-3-succinoylpyridine 3-monooxygenase HspA [Tropicibacter naphthalenivorans]SMC73449.1 Uncharacterized conserved protein, LabA/DUF88 family [Tropicibacter naphthalenivorans]
MRARVYVDGFNLYYRLLKGTDCKWCNLKSLAESLLDKKDTVEAIRYFTADISPRAGDEEAPQRQSTYLRALKTIPELSIHKGKFLPKTITRPLKSDPSTYVTVLDTEEKGSDVNLASHLLLDAFSDAYDVALVLSQDTDLLEPMRMVREELGKKVVLGWFEQSSPGKKHKATCSAIRHVSPKMLRDAQFPDTVIGRGGARIERPKTWF